MDVGWSSLRHAPSSNGWTHQLFEAVIDPVLVLDLEGRIIDLNSGARAELGFQADVTGLVLWSLRPDLESGSLWTEFYDVVETGCPSEGGSLDVGNTQWMQYRIRILNEGKQDRRCVTISWRVATRERLLEASLADLHTRLDFLSSVGRVVQYVSDLATNRIQFSKNGLRKFGCTTMRGDEFLANVVPADRTRLAGLRQAAIEADGDPVQTDFRYRHPDGRALLFRMRAVFEPAPPGRNDRVSGVAILLSDENPDLSQATPLTGIHVRAARGVLGWSVNELASRSKVSASTIIRIEAEPGLPKARGKALDGLKNSLEAAGIRFFVDESGCPAVSFRQPDAPGGVLSGSG